VLKEGHIAEQGGFAELMRRGGVFAELYNIQFADAKPAPAS
jgi:ABC-type multidrug transport system fused ATPase/permease subunit